MGQTADNSRLNYRVKICPRPYGADPTPYDCIETIQSPESRLESAAQNVSFLYTYLICPRPYGADKKGKDSSPM